MAGGHDPLLRPGLLNGRVMVLARAGQGSAATMPAADAVSARARALGARVFELTADPGDERAADVALAEIMTRQRAIDVLVTTTAGGGAGEARPRADAGADDGGLGDLRAVLDGAWTATRAVANAAFIPDARGGKVVHVACPSYSRPRAEAIRAGLENMARTLSIEWARYGVRVVTILPGEHTDADELASLVAFLASGAGDYYSGCSLELGGV